MKKLLVTLQVLACCSLVAAEPANKNRPKNDSCNQECAPDPCPCFQRGDDPIVSMPMTCKYPAAYNHPANIKVESCWDFFADVSYLYWYTGEDNLDLAATAAYETSYIYPTESNGQAVFQKFNYTSGFKVGLGSNLNVDDWVLDLEYTYLRQSTTTSQTAPASTITATNGVYDFTGWFTENYYSFGIVAKQFDTKWNFGLDWLDLNFKRPYYLGRRLVITPSAGLRASWIRQNLKITSETAAYPDTVEPLTNADESKNHNNSWAIGPRGLIDAHWLIGGGFRFQGNMGASVLFTQYTKISHNETGILHPAQLSITNYNCLRPMAEGNLGLGWGRYYFDNSYHFDLSATYDFNYLFSQNMLKYASDLAGDRTATPADIFIHGLTVKTRFDF